MDTYIDYYVWLHLNLTPRRVWEYGNLQNYKAPLVFSCLRSTFWSNGSLIYTYRDIHEFINSLRQVLLFKPDRFLNLPTYFFKLQSLWCFKSCHNIFSKYDSNGIQWSLYNHKQFLIFNYTGWARIKAWLTDHILSQVVKKTVFKKLATRSDVPLKCLFWLRMLYYTTVSR
jgi:hypothetical protein